MAKHYHIFIVNQSPVIAGCKCFNSEIKDSPVECNPHFEEVAPCEGGGIEISR